MKTILLTISMTLGMIATSFAQDKVISETVEAKSYGSTRSSYGSTGSSYGSTGSAFKAPSYGSTGSAYRTPKSSYGSLGSSYKAETSYGSNGNKLFSGKVRSQVRSRVDKVTSKVVNVTSVFGNDSVTQHLIEDHGVPASYVYSLNARERQDLHNKLHR